jgi:hypothetical protein
VSQQLGPTQRIGANNCTLDDLPNVSLARSCTHLACCNVEALHKLVVSKDNKKGARCPVNGCEVVLSLDAGIEEDVLLAEALQTAGGSLEGVNVVDVRQAPNGTYKVRSRDGGGHVAADARRIQGSEWSGKRKRAADGEDSAAVRKGALGDGLVNTVEPPVMVSSSSMPFTRSEDVLLWRLYREEGVGWVEINRRLGGRRNGDAIRKRYDVLQRAAQAEVEAANEAAEAEGEGEGEDGNEEGKEDEEGAAAAREEKHEVDMDEAEMVDGLQLQRSARSSSGYVGVYLDRYGRFQTSVRGRYVGVFATAQEAAVCYARMSNGLDDDDDPKDHEASGAEGKEDGEEGNEEEDEEADGEEEGGDHEAGEEEEGEEAPGPSRTERTRIKSTLAPGCAVRVLRDGMEGEAAATFDVGS